MKPKPAARNLPAALPDAPRLPLPAVIRRALARVRRRHLFVGLSEGFVLVAIAILGLALLQTSADWFLNLPWTVRLIFLMGDLALLAWIIYRFLGIPLARRLNSESAALLIERSQPQFRSGLISSVQLTAGGRGCLQGSPELVSRLTGKVAAKIGTVDMARQVVRTDRLRRLFKYLVLCLLLSIGAAFWFSSGSMILLRRILLSNTPLPTMTRVFAVTGDSDLPEGSDVELAARAEGVVPRTGRVILVHDDGRREVVTAEARPGEKEVFSIRLPNVRGGFRYHFEIGDGVGETARVTTRVLPAVTAVRYTQIFPEYTGRGELTMAPGSLTLLAGGRLRIEGEANQPVRAARLTIEGAGNETISMDVSAPSGFRVELPVPASGAQSLSVQVENEKGETSPPMTSRLDIRQDTPPVVSLVQPRSEKSTAQSNAKIPVAYSIKDDFGVSRVALEYEIFRPVTRDQADMPPEKGSIPLPVPPGGITAAQPFVWDLSLLLPALDIGSKVRFQIEAEDGNSLTGPGRGVSRSRLVTIVSDEEKRLELLEAFGRTATKVESLIKTQEKINRTTGSAVKSSP